MATPSQRHLAASVGALARWSRTPSATERRAALDAAREGLARKWREVAIAAGAVTEEEIVAGAKRAQREHLARAALASMRARSRH